MQSQTDFSGADSFEEREEKLQALLLTIMEMPLQKLSKAQTDVLHREVEGLKSSLSDEQNQTKDLLLRTLSLLETQKALKTDLSEPLQHLTAELVKFRNRNENNWSLQQETNRDFVDTAEKNQQISLKKLGTIEASLAEIQANSLENEFEQKLQFFHLKTYKKFDGIKSFQIVILLLVLLNFVLLSLIIVKLFFPSLIVTLS
ncbi:hypothetical protein FAI40_03885 [Acetobacteraceae bacterium]|nr:hypothetical protein FAI40_03885 [Acetobacteraceae bacterium]